MAEQIQFRRYNNSTGIPVSDRRAVVGEPFYDSTNRRLGMFPNTTATHIDWYPVVIGDRMFMNRYQHLSGYTDTNNQSNIELDWSVQDELRVVNRSTGAYYVLGPTGGGSVIGGVPWAPDPLDNTDTTHVTTPRDVYLAIQEFAPVGQLPVTRATGAVVYVDLA